MIEVVSRQNQKIAILGLGVSGLASAKALRKSGAKVTVWDDNLASRDRAVREGLDVVELTEPHISTLDALLASPGIPLTINRHPAIERAKALACPIINDIELLAENVGETHLIGITGTNGKSTTTELISHILEKNKGPCEAGGNLGRPVLEFELPKKNQAYIIELSSFQLELTKQAAFDIAVLLNIRPDHLDRHGTMEAYVSAKMRLFKKNRSGKKGIAIIGVDDIDSRGIFDILKNNKNWNVIPVSVLRELTNGVFVKKGVILDASQGEPDRICDLSRFPNLRGKHNHHNAACAYLAAKYSGVPKNIIVNSFETFHGLEHRLELVTSLLDVEVINDSKATNIAATNTALSCFNNVYWIAGGRSKGENFSGLLPYAASVNHAFLIGEASESLSEALTPTVSNTICENLENATRKAIETAKKDPQPATVLFSPACSSFDQFQNFSSRGREFKRITLETLEVSLD